MLKSTTLTDLPSTKAACDLLGIDYDLVVVINNDSGGNLGVYEPRCIDGANVAHHARIVTYRRNASNQDFEWGVGNVSSNELDLVHNWAHEFGHALGIGHPGSGEIAVMQQTGVSRNRGTNRQRDLYQYDINCAQNISGTRSLSGYRRFSSGIDTIGAESMYTGEWSTFFGSVGVTKFDGSWSWTATAGKSSSHMWMKDLNTSGSWGFVPATTAMWSVPVLFREDPLLNDRAFYSLINETPQYQANAVHSVRYNRSPDGFASASWGDMTHCSTMSIWMICNGI